MTEPVEWIVFYDKHTNDELLAITAKETFPGEVESTIELLAFENKIKEIDIEIKYEQK